MHELETQGERRNGKASDGDMRQRPALALHGSGCVVRAVHRGGGGCGERAAQMAGVSEGEATLALHIRADKLPEPVREYRFAPDRKWRFDFAWPDRKLAVEVEGGVYSGGRHTRGSGYIKDLEKYNRAAVLGWCVLRFDTAAVRDGTAIAAIHEALA